VSINFDIVDARYLDGRDARIVVLQDGHKAEMQRLARYSVVHE
jgi:hypothetical protein